mmetsp:Transcript_2082/g.5975  ORF Transcript_2082/g.5975 Transcript_2082/m.5975 type:complete len:486 (-) Transcript_2082:2528-3985(-)
MKAKEQAMTELEQTAERTREVLLGVEGEVEGLREKLAAAIAAEKEAKEQLAATKEGGDDDTISPFKGKVGSASNTDLASSSNQAGLEAIRTGTVAAVLMAGGQGTRLGLSGPKGKADIGLPSGRTLFALIAERIRKLRLLALASAPDNDGGSSNLPSLPLFIMTSPMNHEETENYFKDNSYFGLPSTDVICFRQGTLPCVEVEGDDASTMKIIQETADQVARAPDGNGGIFPALQSTGCLDDMVKRGIEHLHVFSVDNALVRPADPAFVGYCISQKADCGNKSVWRAAPDEKVGVLVTKDDRPMVVEYSELSASMASAVDETGKLKYGAANICSHYFSVDFIRNTVLTASASDIPYHIARKKIPYWDSEQNETVTPDKPNGIKLEIFIFDVFPLSKSMAVWEVERTDEFAPVKNANADGVADTPDTARKLLSNLAEKWLTDTGAKLHKTGDEADKASCEIAPATSYAGEGLEKYNGKVVASPFTL